MYWDTDPDELNAEADAFAKKWAEIIRRAKTPRPAELMQRVREELAKVETEKEWNRLVDNRVMELIYDKFGHRCRCVEVERG